MPQTKHLVHETATGTGTGNLTVAAINGKQRISTAYGTGDNGAANPILYISNREAAEWEVVRGYMSDANTLVRGATPIDSSNGGAAVSFSAGNKDVTSAPDASFYNTLHGTFRVRVLSTTNVAIATALENSDTLNGVTLATGDLVLLTGQTAPAENGVYVVPASGAASRYPDFATYDSLPGTLFSVMQGTAKADTLWQCTSNRGGTLGSTAIAISEFSANSVVLAAITAAALATSATGPSPMINGAFNVSAGSGILTIAIKTLAGADPSAADPVLIPIINGTGGYATRLVTAALSLVLSSGSTFGVANSQPFNLWLMAFDNAGTVVLGAVQCRNGLTITSLDDGTPYTTTAEGGAGGADTAQTVYTSSALTSKYMTILGKISFESGLATAGTWVAPSSYVLAGPNLVLPGQVTGNIRQSTKTDTFTTTSTTLTDITGMTIAITPRSTINAVRVSTSINHTTDAGGLSAVAALLRAGSVILAGAAASARTPGIFGVPRLTDGVSLHSAAMSGLDFPASTSSTTYKLQALVQSGGTYYVNRTAIDGDSSNVARTSSFITVEEIVA